MNEHTVATDKSDLAKLIDQRITLLKGIKSQKDIAAEVGYDNANMISMLKAGTAKVPIEKTYLLAKALEVDPAKMLRLVLLQSWTNPGAAQAVHQIVGDLVTENERKILRVIRAASNDTDPALHPDLRNELERLFTPGKK